jgi:uncharacterized membrane protein YdbT with pleckstrin-like domain
MAKDMLPGETLILRDHPHWIVPARNLVIPVVLVIAVLIADFTFLYDNYVPHLRLFLSFGVLALALLWLIVVWIRWQSTAYTLTDQRIKIESGVFGRQSKIIPIDRIQDCSTKQPLIGRMLGYGRVEVDAAGAQGAEVLAYLPNPGAFRDQVFMQSERRRGGAAPAPGAPSAPVNPSGV